MLRLEGLKLPLDGGEEQLKAKAAALLGCRTGEIAALQVLRRPSTHGTACGSCTLWPSR